MCQWTAARRDEMNKRRDEEKAAEQELIALQRRLYGPCAQVHRLSANEVRKLILTSQRDRAMAESQLAETEQKMAMLNSARSLAQLAGTNRARADVKIVKIDEELAALAPSPSPFAPRQPHTREEPRTLRKASLLNKTSGGRVTKQTKKILSPPAPSMKCRPTSTQEQIDSEPASPEGTTTPTTTPPSTPRKVAYKHTGTE